jgi:putative hemolysin
MTVEFAPDETKNMQKPANIGELGSLSTRLAENEAELKEAQKIRYQVFCDELSARQQSKLDTRLEQEQHDMICDHLLVLDNSDENNSKTVGTQRFLVKQSKDTHLPFRSQSEFDLEDLAVRHPEKRFMELGRSCILEPYRSKRTMELMWHGTWSYAVKNKVDVMTGCASFYAESPEEISLALGFLSTLTSDNPEWQVSPTSPNNVAIKQYEKWVTDPKKAIRALPPLIKGYLRLGAYFSDAVVTDEDFGTIDIAVILPVKNINPRYVRYYGADASKHSKNNT